MIGARPTTLQTLRAWHGAEAARLLGNARREMDRLPMRVSINDCVGWVEQARHHLDACDLLERTIHGG